MQVSALAELEVDVKERSSNLPGDLPIRMSTAVTLHIKELDHSGPAMRIALTDHTRLTSRCRPDAVPRRSAYIDEQSSQASANRCHCRRSAATSSTAS